MLPSAVSNSRVHNILPNKIETDFQFSRASSATRVNHKGLIENVGYFGPELVQNGNFSELGSELITNGDFATNSDWTFQGSTIFINDGKLVFQNALTNTEYAQQAIVAPTGKTYKITFTVSDLSIGDSIKVRFPYQNTTVNSNGTHSIYGVGTTANFIRFTPNSSTGTFKIDNVSVKQVDPDDRWSVGVGWNITDKANFDDTVTSAIYQSGLTLTSGKKYKLTFTISDSSGNTSIWIGNSAGSVNYEGGTYRTFTNGNHTIVFNMPSDQTTLAFYGNTSGVSFSIDNISLVEVIGDKPRLDYDPLNPTCPHLLLEPQSTNLFPFSEDFTQSEWTKSNTTVTSNIIESPQGLLNASLIKENSSNVLHWIGDSVSVTSGSSYSVSVFAKKKERSVLQIVLSTNFLASSYANYDLDSGVVSATGGSVTAKIVQMQNDWYRCILSFTAIATNSGTPLLAIQNSTTASRGAAYQGDGASGLYLYGAMFEQQSYATSYIPTAGATATRVAETCTNAGNVNTFNSTEGVLYAEIQAFNLDGGLRYISIGGSTDTNRLVIRFLNTTGNIGAFSFANGVITSIMEDTSTNPLVFNKVAMKWKVNDFALWVNGNEVSTDTSGATFALGVLDRVQFSNPQGTSIFYGKVKGLATYNRALTDTELYTITSTQYSAYSGMVAALGNYTIPC